MIRTIWLAAVGLAVLGTVAVKLATNPVFELSINLKSLSVGKGEDLHHDHAGDSRRRVDPIIRVQQAGPCEAAHLATAEDGINVDHVSKPPSQLNARKQIHVVRQHRVCRLEDPCPEVANLVFGHQGNGLRPEDTWLAETSAIQQGLEQD